MHHATDILILGSGIGGYETYRSLSTLLKRFRLPQRITLVDRHNYFSFAPMHHEVATGSIEPSHCTIPIREFIAGTPHAFLKTVVTHIDPVKKIATTRHGTISYEYCVVALGSGTNYFGVPGAKEHSHHVRHFANALALQSALIKKFESADPEIDIVIVGGGATGTELAGQIGYFARKDVRAFYPEKTVRVHLVHQGDAILAMLPKQIQNAAKKRLTRYGVYFHLGQAVTRVDTHAISLANGENIRTDLTVWAAGFTTVADTLLPEQFCQKGRIAVTSNLNHKDAPSLYAVGDIALAFNPNAREAHPQLAEAAHKQGRYVAGHILATLRGKKIPKFVFHSTGSLLPIGDWYGVGTVGPLKLAGWFTWWLRRTVYMLFMPRFFRKLRIVADWTLHSLGSRYMVDLEK